MRDPSGYYDLFEEALARRDANLAEKFRSLAETSSPRHVFLWLDDLKNKGLFPEELEQDLDDFYSLFF
jgi:hypothetical protein